MIEIDITKRIKTYRGWLDLKVNTQFETEKITRITGPSGVGKTTLLKILAGLITPEQGTIKFKEVMWFDAGRKYSKRIQERNVGFVFQDYALFPNMSVEQHLKFGTQDPGYIDELLAIGEMESFRENLPNQLSGGQQQRLAILRALSTKPTLLLMDEAFSALDKKLKSRLMERFETIISAQGTTVLLVTHQESEFEGYPNIYHMEE